MLRAYLVHNLPGGLLHKVRPGVEVEAHELRKRLQPTQRAPNSLGRQRGRELAADGEGVALVVTELREVLGHRVD
jgi:hypothetical protein